MKSLIITFVIALPLGLFARLVQFNNLPPYADKCLVLWFDAQTSIAIAKSQLAHEVTAPDTAIEFTIQCPSLLCMHAKLPTDAYTFRPGAQISVWDSGIYLDGTSCKWRGEPPSSLPASAPATTTTMH